MIPYGRQDISEQDIAAVVETLRSDYLTQGQRILEFEKKLACHCETKGAVAIMNATSALHLACLALGVQKGDVVWTSPISFVASANVALYCGAAVDFVDVDVDTGLMSPKALQLKLEAAAVVGRLPKVIIPVHLGGQSCDMEQIHRCVSPYGIHILEDASHAIGGHYESQPIGACQFSDASVFSFHPVKIVTTAEGGAVTSNDEKLLQTVASLRSHGVTRDESQFTEPSHGPWYYQQQLLGFNYRMTELQAALGMSQLDRLKQFVDRRIELANRYQHYFKNGEFAEHGIAPLVVSKPSHSAWHLYVIRCPSEIRNNLFQHLRDAGVLVNLHYIPIHLQPYYQSLGFEKGDFPNAEHYYSQAMSLPLFPGLTDEQQDSIVQCIGDFLRGKRA